MGGVPAGTSLGAAAAAQFEALFFGSGLLLGFSRHLLLHVGHRVLCYTHCGAAFSHEPSRRRRLHRLLALQRLLLCEMWRV